MDQAERTLVEQTMDETRVSLRNALSWFWPARGNAEIAEANLVHQLAANLQSKGFATFCEVPMAGGGRIDLVGLRPCDRMAILVEGKRLFSGQAYAMAYDSRRMRDAKLPRAYDGCEFTGPAVSIIAATTWQKSIAEWWESSRATGPSGAWADGWNALALELNRSDLVRAIPIPRDDDAEWGTHFIVYAASRRPSIHLARV